MKKKNSIVGKRIEDIQTNENWGPIRRHSNRYQPPDYIRDGRAGFKQVLLNGSSTIFYHGFRRNSVRVTFEISDTADASYRSGWYYIDYNRNRDRSNLNEILHNRQRLRIY